MSSGTLETATGTSATRQECASNRRLSPRPFSARAKPMSSTPAGSRFAFTGGPAATCCATARNDAAPSRRPRPMRSARFKKEGPSNSTDGATGLGARAPDNAFARNPTSRLTSTLSSSQKALLAGTPAAKRAISWLRKSGSSSQIANSHSARKVAGRSANRANKNGVCHSRLHTDDSGMPSANKAAPTRGECCSSVNMFSRAVGVK